MSTADAPTGRRRRARIVFVVDDDPDCRELIGTILKDAGYAVFDAADGADALRLLLAEGTPRPSVIVLDLGLPVISGPEVFKSLKSDHRLSRIPVILTSAGPRYIAATGADVGWLPKPFEPERLLALVAEYSQRARTNEDPSGTFGIA